MQIDCLVQPKVKQFRCPRGSLSYQSERNGSVYEALDCAARRFRVALVTASLGCKGRKID